MHYITIATFDSLENRPKKKELKRCWSQMLMSHYNSYLEARSTTIDFVLKTLNPPSPQGDSPIS